MTLQIHPRLDQSRARLVHSGLSLHRVGQKYQVWHPIDSIDRQPDFPTLGPYVALAARLSMACASFFLLFCVRQAAGCRVRLVWGELSL